MVSPVCVKETRYRVGSDTTTFNSACRTHLYPAFTIRNLEQSTRRYKTLKLKGENIFFLGGRKKEKDTKCIVEVLCGAGIVGLGYKLIIHAKYFNLHLLYKFWFSLPEHNVKVFTVKKYFIKINVQQPCRGLTIIKSPKVATLLLLYENKCPFWVAINRRLPNYTPYYVSYSGVSHWRVTCEQIHMLDQISFTETHLSRERKTISVCYRLPIYNLHHKSMSDYFNAKCF